MLGEQIEELMGKITSQRVINVEPIQLELLSILSRTMNV
jgi:hypothetical protein